MTGTLVVADTGRRLHLIASSGRALCGKVLDPRDVYEQGGHAAWADRPGARCKSCVSKAGLPPDASSLSPLEQLT